jgi:hypothetical protein
MSYLRQLEVFPKHASAGRWIQQVFCLCSLIVAVSLLGSGTLFAASATARFSPTSLAFPTEPLGKAAPVQSITLSNTGSATMTISSIGITGVSIHDFKETSNCGSSLAAGSSCTITVTFSPTASGSRYADVTVADNAAGSPQSVSLTGTGETIPGAALSPGSLAFPTEPLGNAAPTQSVTLKNTGSAALSISKIAITGVSINDFKQTNTCGSSLANGATCTITVTFSPTASGSRYADVTVTDNAASSTQSVTLTGTGTTTVGLLISPSSLAFPSEPIGKPAPSQALTLLNSGSSALSISRIAITGVSINDFKETNTCGSSLAKGATCTVAVVFSPTAAGSRYADVTVTDSATGSPQSVAVTGTGGSSSGSGSVSLSTTSLSFGSDPVGETSSSQSVKVTNTGSAALSITSISLSGTNAADFTEANTCGSSLAAGSSCNIAVLMTPSGCETRSATLKIADNATGSPQSVALSGTGIHDVVLSWSASSSSVTGYNVYRGTKSGGESATPLNSSAVTGTTFTDTSVAAGQTYYYVVTAVDGSTQSSDSNQASATVPTT